MTKALQSALLKVLKDIPLSADGLTEAEAVALMRFVAELLEPLDD